MRPTNQSRDSYNSNDSSNQLTPAKSPDESSLLARKRPVSNFVVTVGESNKGLQINSKSMRSASPFEGVFANFWVQMRTWENVFFLLVILLEMIIGVSQTQGVPRTALPFFVLALIRAAFEHFRERELQAFARPNNEWKYSVFRGDKFVFVKGHQIRAGDIIQIDPLNEVPADCVFLLSKSDLQYCFISTANLDSNLSLTRKETPDLGADLLNAGFESVLKYLRGSLIQAEHFNPDLYSWEAVLSVKDKHIALNQQNLLPSNSFLRSNSSVFAVAVYTGNWAKAQTGRPFIRQKSSQFAQFADKVHYFFIAVVVVVALVFTLVNMIILLTNKSLVSSWFLFDQENVFINLISHWGGWIVVLSRLVPMNFKAALIIGQYYQAKTAKDQLKQVHIEGFVRKGYPKKVPRNRIINHRAIENLGQVDLVMTGKTGTLTSFSAVVEKLRCANQLYDEGFEEEENLLSVRNNILVKNMSEDSDLGRKTREILRAMALCNNVGFSLGISDLFVGTSPEEIAFCNFARKYGAILTNTQERAKTRTLDENFGEMHLQAQRDYHILCQFEFDLECQRNSAVLYVKGEDNEHKVVVYSRGSIRGLQSTIGRSSRPDFEVGVAKLRKDLEFGFQCCLFARKELSVRQFAAIVRSVDPDAAGDVSEENPVSSMRRMLTAISQASKEKLRNKVEADLEFLGSACTKEFIEKKLPETFDFLHKAGISSWVVSSDALNVCIYVCRRLGLIGAQAQTKIIMTMDHPDDVSPESIANFKTRVDNSQNDPSRFCLAVSGPCLQKLIEMEDTNPDLFVDFLYILFAGTIAIFGELTATQKLKLVKLFRRENPEKVVLAIGDGPNDEMMLASAHVGVSLFKGQQYLTCRSADVYMQKFHQLRVLLFGFGVDAHRKGARVLRLSVYAAVLLAMPELISAPFGYFFPRRLLPDWMSSVVAIVLPLFGMVVYATNDRLFDPEQVIKSGGFYKLSRENVFSSWKAVLKSVINGVVTGLLLTLLALALFDFGTYKDGKFFGWFSFGNMVTLGILLVLAMRFVSVSNTFSFLLVLVPAIMLLVYFFMWLLMSFVSGSDLFDTFQEVVLSPQLYVYLCVVIGVGLAEGLLVKIDLYSMLADLDVTETFQKRGNVFRQDGFQSHSESGQVSKNSSDGNLMKDDYRDSDSD